MARTADRSLLLLGGNEWQPGSLAADSWWLARARAPEVTVVTSAAQDIPETQVKWAEEHFRALGARVTGCLIQTPADAQDPGLLAGLERASAIYLCGGDPGAAQAVLVGSAAGRALGSAYRRGVPMAGSSAGAMVLGGGCLAPGSGFRLLPGLGLVPGLVVVPHWGGAGTGWRELARELSRERPVVGIDESTGLCWDGLNWLVLGPGRAVRVLGDQESAAEGSDLPRPVE